MRFDNTLDSNRRDGGINGIAARLKHFQSRTRRQGMRGRGRSFSRKNRGPARSLKITLH
jgi:hypothetical protein